MAVDLAGLVAEAAESDYLPDYSYDLYSFVDALSADRKDDCEVVRRRVFLLSDQTAISLSNSSFLGKIALLVQAK